MVVGVSEVGLVPDELHRYFAGVDLAQHGVDRGDAPSASGELASTTCNSRSASTTSSSVDRNASTSWCGSRRTKPTVSDSNTVSPPGSRSRRVVGSSVENNWFSTSTPACVNWLSSVDLPAFV